jgi:hypothetical protein
LSDLELNYLYKNELNSVPITNLEFAYNFAHPILDSRKIFDLSKKGRHLSIVGEPVHEIDLINSPLCQDIQINTCTSTVTKDDGHVKFTDTNQILKTSTWLGLSGDMSFSIWVRRDIIGMLSTVVNIGGQTSDIGNIFSLGYTTTNQFFWSFQTQPTTEMLTSNIYNDVGVKIKNIKEK